MLECAARPETSTCQRTGPLWASTTAIDVGSPTKTMRGTCQLGAHLGDHRAYAEAADLLVIGEEEVDRHFEPAALKVRHGCQNASEKPLHVGGAAPIEAAAALGEREGVRLPGCAVRRDDIRMARRGRRREFPTVRWWRRGTPSCRRSRERARRRRRAARGSPRRSAQAPCWICGSSCRRRRGGRAAPSPNSGRLSWGHSPGPVHGPRRRSARASRNRRHLSLRSAPHRGCRARRRGLRRRKTRRLHPSSGSCPP